VRVASRVGDGDQFDAIQIAQHPGVVASHGPNTEKSGP
jgi:hypothetical protein